MINKIFDLLVKSGHKEDEKEIERIILRMTYDV